MLALLAATAIAATAAAPAAALPTLTLDGALSQARERNLDLKVANARLAQARETSAKTWANYLPQLSVGGAFTWNSTEAKIKLPTGYYVRNLGEAQGPPFDPKKEPSPENPPGGQTSYILFPSGFAEAVVQRQDQLGAQAQLSQALIAPSLWPGIQAAYLGERAAELGVESARREILFAVAQVYLGANGLKQALAVQQQLLESHREHERDAQVKVNAGAVPQMVLLRAQIDRARAELDVKRSENAYVAMKSSLAMLLDRDVDFDVVPPETLPIPALDEKADLAAQALASRPDVEGARVGVELARKQARVALLKYLPTLGASARYQASNVEGFAGTGTMWSVSLGLNWNVFDGGLREAERREAAAKVEEALVSARATEVKAQDELRRALLDLDSARSNGLKSEEQLKLARENRKLVEVAYQAGTATPVEVSDANTALLAAELGHVAEKLNAQLALLKLAKAAGAFDPR